jgi:hypothetical protein
LGFGFVIEQKFGDFACGGVQKIIVAKTKENLTYICKK